MFKCGARSKKLMAVLALCVAVVTSLLPLADVKALSATDFNSGNIIDNTVFFNRDSMSVSDIQAFLNSKVPTCDSNHAASGSNTPPFTCLKDYQQAVPAITPDTYCTNAASAGTKSAAQIIKDVAMACSVSPKVLLVLLQKEQGLITDTWPWSTQYRSATGYGCPDTAACDSAYYGFFNQVYNAAKAFQRYTKVPQNYNYAAGKTSFVAFQANNSACGGTNVFMQNAATAALYNYTPYQPNSAALNNLNGSGDSCSAYGNRNFWRYFNDWFGNTHTVIALQPSVVVPDTNYVNLYARANDGRLLERWFDGTKWNTIYNNVAGSYIETPPAAVSLGGGHKDVFTISGGSIVHRYYLPDGSGWHGWADLGHPSGTKFSSTPAVVSPGPGLINVYARGDDGRLWEKWFDSNGWIGSWNNVSSSSIDSMPAVFSFGNGHKDLFQTTNSGTIMHRYYLPDTIGWRGWEELGHPAGVSLVSTPAVVSKSAGKINIFVKGSDGRLWEKWFENGQWTSAWNNLDNSSISSTPAAYTFGNGHIDLFETTSDGSIRHRYYLPDTIGWRPWEYL